MSTETIDHNTLARLVEAGAVRAAHVIGQVGGWGVLIKYGMVERPLSATRSRQVRIFKKLETVVSYLKDLGISRFDVDAANYDANTMKTHARPDSSEQMKRAHEAAAHDQWFRAQVEQAISEADDPNTQWVSNEEAATSWDKKRAALTAQLKESAL